MFIFQSRLCTAALYRRANWLKLLAVDHGNGAVDNIFLLKMAAIMERLTYWCTGFFISILQLLFVVSGGLLTGSSSRKQHLIKDFYVHTEVSISIWVVKNTV